MKIAFLSWLSPYDIQNWSGTLFYIYHSLSQTNDITWVGYEEIKEIRAFHQRHHYNFNFNIESYSSLFGLLFSKYFSREDYDLIIARDAAFIAYLSVDIPIVLIADTTYKLFSQYLGDFNEELNLLESRAFHNCSKIILSSEWARNSVIYDYEIKREITEVIEFGANIPFKASPILKEPNECNLIFIGRNWTMKGGDKALEIYFKLKDLGYTCSLTCLGSSPKELIKDPDIHIYEYVDKSTKEGRELFSSILKKSTLLIAPTLFDCFGIMFCEAAAYGIPVLTNNVGGVGQVIRDDVNGFLFSPKATVDEYVDKIRLLLTEKTLYQKLSYQALQEYKERLNWSVWLKRIHKLLEPLSLKIPEFYIPTYIINLKDRKERRKHILEQFNGREEFQVNLVEACEHKNGRFVKMITLL